MLRPITLLTLLLLLAQTSAWAQRDVFDQLTEDDEDEDEEEELVEGWNTELTFGLDISQLFQLNPKQGAGQNRFGFGGAILADGIYKKNRLLWENGLSWQFGVQRLGSGVIVLPGLGPDIDVPFQKTIDDLRLGSKLGYQLGPESPWYLSAAFTFQSLIAPSYPGPETYPGNFLRNFADTIVNSKFFSPATITLSGGLEFVPNENFSLFFSPLGAKWITVADDLIAAQGIHGNPVDRDSFNEETGLFESFENTDSQLGALLSARFINTWWDERLSFRSRLTLYSNYLNNPQNIDVDWFNELGLEILSGLKLSLLVTVFYDDDVRVQITDLSAPNGIKVDPETGRAVTGRRVSVTQQLLISYKVTF